MTVYQLVAVGYLKISDKQMMLYDNKAYRTEEAAEAAIPEYKESVLAPNPNDELMELKEDPLRVFVKPLEVLQGEMP